MIKAAVISLTEKGRLLSQRMTHDSDFISAQRFCFYKHCDDNAVSFENLSVLTADIFKKYDALIFICACGIAVRCIAPFIASKTCDPAVIVTDDCGRFVIPVLSGHIGGANALARRTASIIGAQAAITTATDTGLLFSPDSFAAANSLIITDLNAAKEIAAALLDGEKTGLVSEYSYTALPDEITSGTGCRTGIYIGNADISPFPVTLRLIPKNIVLGIGCKKGTDFESIKTAVDSALKKAGILFERVCNIATINIKADEPGLLRFCRENSLELSVYSAEELMSISGDFTSSDFVKSITGTDNVCERSAVKCSGGKLLLHKTALCGVTVAAAEIPTIYDFERSML